MSPDGITRRRFVKRSGLAVSAAGMLTLQWEGVAVADTTLTPARRATYAALFSVVQGTNGVAVDAPLVDSALMRFGQDYASTQDSTRTYIDQVLDEIEASHAVGFSNAAPGEQLATLRNWREAAALPEHPGASETARRRHAFADEALAWASSPSALTCEYRVSALPI